MRHVVDTMRGLHAGDRVRASIVPAVSAVIPLRIVRDAWWLAIVAIAVLQQAHAGLHEHRELSPMVHVLRDAALAVPAAAIAIVIATLFVAGGRGIRAAPRPPGKAVRLQWVVIAAIVFAVLSVPGNELHGALFGAEDEEELSWLADLALDAGIALIGALLALAPLAAVAGLPIRDPDASASATVDRPRPVLETSPRSSQ